MRGFEANSSPEQRVIWVTKPGGVFCPHCGRRGGLVSWDMIKCKYTECSYFGDLHWDEIENCPPLNRVLARYIDNEDPTEQLFNRLRTVPPYTYIHDHVFWTMRNDAAEMVSVCGPLRGYAT